MMNMGKHFSFDGKLHSLGQILAGPDNRATQGDAVEHDVKNGRRKVTWWQTNETDRTLPPHETQRLCKR